MKFKLGVYEDLTDLEAEYAAARLQHLQKEIEQERMHRTENDTVSLLMEGLSLLIRVTPKVHNGT